MFRQQRFQVSLGSLLLLMSVAAIGAALYGASIALGSVFLMLALAAFLRTSRVIRHRRLHGSTTTFLSTANDFLYSFWILVCLMVLSPITLVFTVAIGTVHLWTKCLILCRRLTEFFRLSSILAGLVRILNAAWRHLLAMEHRLINRLSPSFGLPDGRSE